MIERPEYLRRIRPFINKDIVKVLTGIRRAGKSTLLHLIRSELQKEGIKPDRMLSVNFEDLRFQQQDYRQIHEMIVGFCQARAETCYIFLDEIQWLLGWEKMVNSLRASIGCDLYVTGSNAKLLSGELATYLAGRYIEIPVYPFSFAEIVKAERERSGGRSQSTLFDHYLRFGGMPFIHVNALEEKDALSYLEDLYQSILLKDVVARYDLRDVELLKRILQYLFSGIGQQFSGTSIVKYLKADKRTISNETIYNYIEYAKGACLLNLVPREDLIGRRLLRFQEKVYVGDHGLREALLGSNLRDISQVLENIVYLQLVRRGYRVTVGRAGEKEVDFACEKQGERAYFQVCYLIADQKVAEREFGAFEGIPDNYEKTVLSLDPVLQSRDGIRHRNLVTFLLEE